LQPQPGPQRMFLSSTADFTIYGGAAGGGKTWALLLEPLYHIDNPEFAAVIFRRTYPQITNEGGLWDESLRLYPLAGGQPRQSDLEWRFPSGATIRFAHLQHEKDKYSWQGSQIPLICFDELTHFSRSQVLYMASRNRSLCGVRPYMRAGTNPDADSWVKELLAPWVDDEHPEFPYPPGRHRYYTVENDNIVWVDASWRDENGLAGKSLTFVPARVTDNQILLAQNPEYLANLRALPLVEQQRLLHGNWKVRPAAGKVFNRAWFEVVDVAPAGAKTVRFWDFAATEATLASDDPDWTVGVKVTRQGGTFYVLDVVRVRASPPEVKRLVKATATQDGTSVAVGWEQEGGSAGKMVKSDLLTFLAGFMARGIPSRGDKVQRAGAASSQALGGNVKLLRGAWNGPFLAELHGFPDLDHDDQVDGLSGGINMLIDMPENEAPKAVVVSRAQVAQQFGL
jgi:predicted phage terminase large subunit-like protein